MRPRILLVNPPIYDFTAYNFWLKPFGMLTALAKLRGSADLVLFDPDKIEDAATFEDPVQPARGVHHVLVNGVPVWADGSVTGQRSGKFLRPGD